MILMRKKISMRCLRLGCLLLLGLGVLQVFKQTIQLFGGPTPQNPVIRQYNTQKELVKSKKLQFFETSNEYLNLQQSNKTKVEIHFHSSNSQENLNENRKNETHQEFMKRMKMRMEIRRKHLQKTCIQLGLNPANKTFDLWSTDIPKPKPWMFLSEKYRFLYAEIPKSGCTNWKKIVMVLRGIANFSDFGKPEAHLNPHANLPHAKYTGLSVYGKALYRNATKLLVVRDPLERLVSAYFDKVAAKKETNISIFAEFSWEVAKKYGTRWTDPTKHFENSLREIKVCEQHAAELNCGSPDERIKIVSASYGRNTNQSCGGNAKWKGNLCYSKEAYFVTSQLCDGKSSCVVAATLGQFGAVSGCIFVHKILTILYKCISIKDLETLTVCSTLSHEIQCPSGGVISIASAVYGRKNKNTCSFRAITFNTDCDSPTATSAVVSACNHRSSCVVYANSDWIQSDSCPSTSKYLQVWYSCIHAVVAEEEDLLHDLLQRHIGNQMTYYETERSGLLNGSHKVKQKSVNAKAKSINSESEKILPPKIYQRPHAIYRKYPLSANFQEFVKYLLDPENADVTNDIIDHGPQGEKATNVRHWQFYHTLTYPCHIDYDIIIHMETIDDDARYFLHLIDAPKYVEYPKGYDQTTGGSRTTRDVIKQLFATLSEDEAKKLLNMYSIDYKLFDYGLPTLN